MRIGTQYVEGLPKSEDSVISGLLFGLEGRMKKIVNSVT